MPTKSEAKDLLGMFIVLVVAFSIYMIIQEVTDMKKELIAYAVLTVVLVSALLYRSYFVEPELEKAYSNVYGLDEDGAEW